MVTVEMAQHWDEETGALTCFTVSVTAEDACEPNQAGLAVHAASLAFRQGLAAVEMATTVAPDDAAALKPPTA